MMLMVKCMGFIKAALRNMLAGGITESFIIGANYVERRIVD
jgi:hypothetical protein